MASNVEVLSQTVTQNTCVAPKVLIITGIVIALLLGFSIGCAGAGAYFMIIHSNIIAYALFGAGGLTLIGEAFISTLIMCAKCLHTKKTTILLQSAKDKEEQLHLPENKVVLDQSADLKEQQDPPNGEPRGSSYRSSSRLGLEEQCEVVTEGVNEILDNNLIAKILENCGLSHFIPSFPTKIYLNSNNELCLLLTKDLEDAADWIRIHDREIPSAFSSEGMLIRIPSDHFFSFFEEPTLVDLIEISPNLGEDLKLLHSPNEDALMSYAKLNDKKTGREKLTGREYGDYVLGSHDNEGEFWVLYVNQEGTISEALITHPHFDNSAKFNEVFAHLRRPITEKIFPPTVIHNSLMAYKFLSYMKATATETTMLLFPSFLRWLAFSPRKFEFHPYFIFKILGHQFSLPGEAKYENHEDYTAQYIGFTGSLAKSILTQDLFDYLPLSFSKQQRSAIITMVQNSVVSASKSNPSLDTLLELLQNDIPITIYSGTNNHAINLTFDNHYFICSNRGAGSGQHPGMNIYKITKPITETILQSLMRDQSIDFFPSPENERSFLSQELGLKYRRTIKTPYQKGPHCAFVSNRLLYQAGLILTNVDDVAAKEDYKNFILQSRIKWIKSLFIFIDKIDLRDNQELKLQLYFAMYFIKAKIQYKMAYKYPGQNRECPYAERCINDLINEKAKSLLENEQNLLGRKYLEKIEENYPNPNEFHPIHQKLLTELEGKIKKRYRS